MKKQYKQPRLAEMIAGDLRARILDGELADGEMLPRQEELLATFNVSPPSLRGALQILETEGLITVLRGSVGGAVVHTPKARGVAYNVGLVLQSNKVGLQDIALSLEHLEPLCVRLCALRDDRSTEVLPYLWALHREIEENLADFELVTRTARAFHEELVARCGNETLILVAGALETIWSAHERVWVDTMAETGAAPRSTSSAPTWRSTSRSSRPSRPATPTRPPAWPPSTCRAPSGRSSLRPTRWSMPHWCSRPGSAMTTATALGADRQAPGWGSSQRSSSRFFWIFPDRVIGSSGSTRHATGIFCRASRRCSR